MLALVVAEGVAIALLGLLVAGLLRSHADILRALHSLGADLDPGSPGTAGQATLPATIPTLGTSERAHDVAGHRLDGSAVAVGVVGTQHDTMLAFLSSGCSSCRPFWEALAEGGDALTDARVEVVVQDEDSVSRLRELAGPGLEPVRSSQAWQDYGVPGSPHFVHVQGPLGRVIGEGTAQTWPQIVDMFTQARADAPAADTDGAGVDPHDNPARIDSDLAAAGIGAGHPSLYPHG
jgi:hypothetical protein